MLQIISSVQYFPVQTLQSALTIIFYIDSVALWKAPIKKEDTKLNGTNPKSIATQEVRQKVAELVANGFPKPVLSRDVLPVWGIIPRLINPRLILRGEKAKLVLRIVRAIASIEAFDKLPSDETSLRELCQRAILLNLIHIAEVQFATLASGAMPDITVSTTQYRGPDRKYHCWTCGNVSEATQFSLSEHFLGMGGGTGCTKRVIVPYCPTCGEKEPEGRGLVMIPLELDNIPYCNSSILGVVIGNYSSLVYRFHKSLPVVA